MGFKDNCCQDVLKQYHHLQEEVISLYQTAKDINTKSVTQIAQIISSLDKSITLEEEALCHALTAEELIEKSECCCRCSKNTCECKLLEDRYKSLNKQSIHELINAVQYLKAALASIQVSIATADTASKVHKAASNCVSQTLSKCIPEPPCNNFTKSDMYED